MADYSSTSPYSETGMTGDYLDVLNPRTLSAEQDDQSYTREDLRIQTRSVGIRSIWFTETVVGVRAT
jgi:hypothetical protein